MSHPDLSRRTVLGVLGGGAVTVAAGCGGETDSEPSAELTPGSTLVATAEVPVGSAVILKEQKVVVAQPTKGTFKGFTAVCTHQGCTVGTVSGNEILCPCHGSVFSAEDGSVVEGPAENPLAAVEVTVEGDQVVTA